MDTSSALLPDVSLSSSSKKRLILHHTKADGHNLSTNSLTLFEVIHRIIVLTVTQVLHQTSTGMVSKTAAKELEVIRLYLSGVCLFFNDDRTKKGGQQETVQILLVIQTDKKWTDEENENIEHLGTQQCSEDPWGVRRVCE